MEGDARNIDAAALEMDEKKHVVGHQTAQREHLRDEEVAILPTVPGGFV